MNTAIVDFITYDAMTLYEVHMGNTSFKIMDRSVSLTAPSVFRELAGNHYKLNGRAFADGDVLLDIGANVGIVSIFIAKQLPNCTIYAYEPLPYNYVNLVRNLLMNDIKNVKPIQAAVTADGRDLTLCFNFENMGGASAFLGKPPYNEINVKSVTLQSIFHTHNIDRVAYMKMDCEGAEHEILDSAGDLLDRVDYLAMEIHYNAKLREAGYSDTTLTNSVQSLIDREAIQAMWVEVAG
jgi:FkbM family methyltransferase